jgi:hypothetical protein
MRRRKPHILIFQFITQKIGYWWYQCTTNAKLFQQVYKFFKKRFFIFPWQNFVLWITIIIIIENFKNSENDKILFLTLGVSHI